MKKYTRKTVCFNDLKNTGKDEWWCNWYECPNCKQHNIAQGFNYCPDCGLKIKYKKSEVEL